MHAHKHYWIHGSLNTTTHSELITYVYAYYTQTFTEHTHWKLLILSFAKNLLEVCFSSGATYEKSSSRSSKTVSSLSAPANDVTINLLYSNALEVHRKNTASHLHVEVHTWLVFITDSLCLKSPQPQSHQFQSVPQTNRLHIHTITNVSARGNNHMQTITVLTHKTVTDIQ